MSEAKVLVVVPQTIEIESSNVPLGDYVEYSPTATYNTNDKVTVLADKRNYICTADGTTGKTPKDNIGTIWIDEPMNRFAALDYKNAKHCVAVGDMVFSFRAINIDAIHLFSVSAKSVTIHVEHVPTATTIFEKTYSMVNTELDGFGDYLFSEQELRDMLSTRLTTTEMQLVIDSMTTEQILSSLTANPPIYYDTRVSVTLHGGGGSTSLGYLIVGRQRELGATLAGGKIGIKSFAPKERNKWGNMVYSDGLAFDTMDVPVIIDSSKILIVKKRLKEIDNYPCVFAANKNFFVFGFYFDLEMPLTNQTSQYNLRIESII